MKKIIKLSESDLVKIIKNVINEQSFAQKIWLTNLSINGESSIATFKTKIGKQTNTFKKMKCSNGVEYDCFNLPGQPNEIPNGNYGYPRFPRKVFDYGIKLYHNNSLYSCMGPNDNENQGLPCKKI